MVEYSNDEIMGLPQDGGHCKKRKFNFCRLLKYAVFAFLCICFVYSAAVYAYASHNKYFADRYSMSVSAALREILASITGFLPFSVAETIVIAAIPLFLLLLIRALVLKLRYKEKGRVKKFFFGLLCVILAVASLFINTFAICYKRPPVSQALSIDTESITEDDVFVSAYLCSIVVSENSGNFSRLPDGQTVMPYDFDEMVRRIYAGYETILTDIPENISVKPVSLSKIWTYTHISGMYFPFTGESNINTNFPDYVLTFSTAHEMAHQFGIAREDDANLLAFLACSYSGDDYLVYSAYMNAFEYLISDLSPRDASLLVMSLDALVTDEFSAYYRHMNEYTVKAVSDISAGANNAYLKANGIAEGSKSYRQVTKLICGYMKNIYGEFYVN